MEAGDYATLIVPYRGYTRILLIERLDLRWLVEICDSGCQIEVYEDEFVTD